MSVYRRVEFVRSLSEYPWWNRYDARRYPTIVGNSGPLLLAPLRRL